MSTLVYVPLTKEQREGELVEILFGDRRNEPASREAYERSGQALWYAFGAEDSGVTLAGDPFTFRDWFAWMVYQYRTEQTFTLPAIQDAFRAWQEQGQES